MADLSPEQDKLNSVRGLAHVAAQELALNLAGLVKTHNQGGQPDTATIREIEAGFATVAEYFALLRKEG